MAEGLSLGPYLTPSLAASHSQVPPQAFQEALTPPSTVSGHFLGLGALTQLLSHWVLLPKL
jgi:hypothetical protein